MKAVNNKKSNNEGKVERVGVTSGRLEGLQEGNEGVKCREAGSKKKRKRQESGYHLRQPAKRR
jgi:hypothetical protein